jgi:transcriptional regulator with PAS, ATPase and Fis domain
MMADLAGLQNELKKASKLEKLNIYSQIIKLRYQQKDWALLDDFQQAIQIFEDYLSFDPKPDETSCLAMQEIFLRTLLAVRFFMRKNHFPEIFHAFEKFQKHFKQPDQLAQIYNNLGYFFWQQKEMKKAIEYNEKCIELANKSCRTDILPSRYSNLGYIYESIEDYKRAQDYYEKQMDFGMTNKLDDSIFYAYCGFGRLNIATANFPAAINYFLEALKYYSNETSEGVMAVYLNLGTCYGRMSEYRESLKYLNKFITDEVRAQNPEMYFSFLINAANCYSDLKEYDKAERYWELALSLAKQHNNREAYTSVLLNSGLAEVKRSNWSGGKLKLEEFIKSMHPNSAQTIIATLSLGRANYHLGNKEKAKEQLIEVLSKTENQEKKLGLSNGFRTLIKIYEEEGDYENALFFYKKFNAFERERLDEKYKFELENIKQRRQIDKKKSSASFNYKQNSLISQELTKRLQAHFIGVSPELKKVVDMALIAAQQGNESVLITGESGTGKEIVSRLIHFASPRRDLPLIVVNSAAITETLSESLFFGYEKGAFTGADSRKIGYFEAAQGGTIFLDEIGDLPLGLQAKFLRAIEEKVIQRLGSTVEHKIDFRLISATNQDISFLAKKNLFRFDLLNRINALEIMIPPLRKRLDDIPFLIDFFISELCYESGREKPLITKEAMQMLLEYHYPGNVRELKNIIRRSLLLNDKTVLSAEDIMLPKAGYTKQTEAVWYSNLQLAYNEEHLIKLAMQKCNGVQAKAAKLLGISPFALNRKLKKMAD